MNIENLDSLTIIILMSWMFVFWVLFWKIPLLWNNNTHKIARKSENISSAKKYITEIEPLVQEEKNPSTSNDSSDFSSFEDVQDTSFLNIANNLKKQKKQDLKIIEWIGPKIEELLNKWGIFSYKDLELSNISTIQSILENAWSRYIMHNPSTWKKQASIAHSWNFEKLQNYQKSLKKWVEV